MPATCKTKKRLAQLEEERQAREREREQAELTGQPIKDTAQRPRSALELPLSRLVGMTNLRVDVLPVLKDGDSCRAASGGASVGSCFTASGQGKPWSYAGSTGV